MVFSYDLYSTTDFIDNRYVVTVYADQNLQIEIHRECSVPVNDIPMFTNDKKVNLAFFDSDNITLHQSLEIQTLEIAISKARCKLGKNLLALAFRKDLYE